MTIRIERIPTTPEVLECLANEDQIAALEQVDHMFASVIKEVDFADADEAFIAVLKGILELPDSKHQPVLIAFR